MLYGRGGKEGRVGCRITGRNAEGEDGRREGAVEE